MLNSMSSSGPLSSRPAANTSYGKYYFDTTNNVYYFSDGEKWMLREIDVNILSPDTESVVIAGISPNNSINPLRLDSNGALIVSGGTGGSGGSGSAYTAGTLEQSASSTSTGSVQTIFAANTARKFLFFQNISDTDMYITIGATAPTVGTGIFLSKGGGSLSCDTFVPTEVVRMICAASGKYFIAYQSI